MVGLGGYQYIRLILDQFNDLPGPPITSEKADCKLPGEVLEERSSHALVLDVIPCATQCIPYIDILWKGGSSKDKASLLFDLGSHTSFPGRVGVTDLKYTWGTNS